MPQVKVIMEFLSLDPVTKELTLNTTVVPQPKANEILVRVAFSGICGTDLHILDVRFIVFVKMLCKYRITFSRAPFRLKMIVR